MNNWILLDEIETGEEMTDQQEHFESWGIVDLFGHTRIAGLISEQAIGGETFIRVDVPNGEGFHTRLFGKGAIYSMSLTDEAIAREMARRSGVKPVSRYEVKNLIEDQREEDPGRPIDFDESDFPV